MGVTGSEQSMVQFPPGWPRTPPGLRKRGQFGKHTVARCIRDLQAVVVRMDASGLRIDTSLQMRRDGLPYSNQRMPEDPGVVVYWMRGGKKYAIACDRYTSVEANLRAIVLTLEAKRGVERWGTTSAEREYAGYEALPPPSGHPVLQSESPTRPAHEVLGVREDATKEEVVRAFRGLAKLHHPDVLGTQEGKTWNELVRARDELLGVGDEDSITK